MPIKPDSKPSKKGNAKRRKVALLAANDHTPAQIADKTGLGLRRVQQMLNERPTIEMLEHFRLAVDRQRLEAEGSLIETLVDKLGGPEWESAADKLERRLAARENLEAKRLGVAATGQAGDGSGGGFQLEEFFTVVRGQRVTTT